MNTLCKVGIGIGVCLIAAGGSIQLAFAVNKPTDIAPQLSNLQKIGEVGDVKAPILENPTWLKDQLAAEAAAKKRTAAAPITVTYSVTNRGVITANMSEFSSQANATLNDNQGWARLGVVFQEVASGGMFTLVMSEASQMTSFSPGCGSEYSCRAGRYVIINQDRWLGATSSWNAAGGSLRDYRHMVVNHETGHWLGHDHATCGGAGNAAPVMQQQSISLQGCLFNPWPTENELWSTQLGITR